MKKAIISDIDGTLAIIGDRDPYNPQTVADDLLNDPVANILHVYSRQNEFPLEIILITGRYEKYRLQTEMWLRKHEIKNHRLFMRADGDKRPDIIFKKEIYRMFLEDTYDIVFVLEDRDRTVRMWRKEIGLTCLQVDYGDF